MALFIINYERVYPIGNGVRLRPGGVDLWRFDSSHPHMTENNDTEKQNSDETEEWDKETLEQKVQEHIEKREEAYVKMGTVDTDPEE